MKPLVLFYHVFAINDWSVICEEHFLAMQHSGLSRICHINFSISGPERRIALSDLRKKSSLFLSSEYYSFEINNFEWSTLDLLWHRASHDDAYYFYLHTKGVSQTGDKKPHVDSWRRYLNYFCISRWRDCVAALGGLADLAGCQYIPATKYFPCHYSGNFWWATSNYIRNLPDPTLFSCERLEAEFWSCRAAHRALNLCSVDMSMYNTSVLPADYEYTSLDPVIYQFCI